MDRSSRGGAESWAAEMRELPTPAAQGLQVPQPPTTLPLGFPWLPPLSPTPSPTSSFFAASCPRGEEDRNFDSVMSVWAGRLYGDDGMVSCLLLVSGMLRAQSECPSLEDKKHQGVCVCAHACVLDKQASGCVCACARMWWGEGNVRSGVCMFACRKLKCL